MIHQLLDTVAHISNSLNLPIDGTTNEIREITVTLRSSYSCKRPCLFLWICENIFSSFHVSGPACSLHSFALKISLEPGWVCAAGVRALASQEGGSLLLPDIHIAFLRDATHPFMRSVVACVTFHLPPIQRVPRALYPPLKRLGREAYS
jgi:hypothetical protein